MNLSSIRRTVDQLASPLLTLHGANRMLEREIPLDAIEGVRMAKGLLTDKPLRFNYRGLTIVARLGHDNKPRIISVWR